MLLISINLSVYNNLFDALRLPEGSILSITDHDGVRLYFRPDKQSNPIGQPLRPAVWQKIGQGGDNGVFLTLGSDGHQRYYAWAKARLTPEAPPYMTYRAEFSFSKMPPRGPEAQRRIDDVQKKPGEGNPPPVIESEGIDGLIAGIMLVAEVGPQAQPDAEPDRRQGVGPATLVVHPKTADQIDAAVHGRKTLENGVRRVHAHIIASRSDLLSQVRPSGPLQLPPQSVKCRLQSLAQPFDVTFRVAPVVHLDQGKAVGAELGVREVRGLPEPAATAVAGILNNDRALRKTLVQATNDLLATLPRR